MKIALCVSCRIALGKLRRVTNIASALRQYNDVSLSLLADSSFDGVSQMLPQFEIEMFEQIENLAAARMSDRLIDIRPDIVVSDTMRIPNLQLVESKLCLILREALDSEIQKFSLPQGRSWDLVILPHPEGHWTPDPDMVVAKRMESVGWIYREPEQPKRKMTTPNGVRTILITAGGGSGEDRGNDFRSQMGVLLRDLRKTVSHQIRIVEILGPRDFKANSIEAADEILRPGPELYDLFSSADLVISAAGYNTVLELACTDVPVLLFPIPRYSDDQEKRAAFWETKLGLCYRANEKQRSVQWMSQMIESRQRRPIVNLGPSGAKRAAMLINDLQK